MELSTSKPKAMMDEGLITCQRIGNHYRHAIMKCVMVVVSITFIFPCAASSRRGLSTRFPRANVRTESFSYTKDVSHRSPPRALQSPVPDPPILHSHLESPFEQLWPDDWLPSWAKKAVNYEVPRNESMCFVHVGKAGGSAVGCSLGFSLHCENRAQQLDGIVPKITTAIFHKDVYNCHENDAYYLFVIRDPIDRAISAFNYDRPDADGDESSHYDRYYRDCSFGTIEEMVLNGLSSHGNGSKHCKSLAFRAIRGTVWEAPSHFYYNYQYYFEAVPANYSIVVIRNEYIIDDWNALEEKMSERNHLMSEDSIPRINANTQFNSDDLFISDESLGILCHALCNEIQIYKKILDMAQNLNAVQVTASHDALAEKCPVEAIVDECPEKMPNIIKKLKENRGYGPDTHNDDDEETVS